MAKTHATIIDDVQALLYDDGTLYLDAKVIPVIDLALIQLSEELIGSDHQYVMMETFQIESRYGTATSDTASALVDATNAQFLATDVGKAIYNSTDKTWAVVTAWVSASQLTLSKDIMVDGDESYQMFNKGCKSIKQINIGDVPDWIDIVRVIYAAQQDPEEERNINIEGDILTLDVEDVDLSKVATSGGQPDVNVYVYFAKRHRVCRQTDLAALVNLQAGYVAGSTSMALDGLTDADGYVYEGTLFTIAGIRGTYTVTADAAISSLAATISFYPGLQSAAADNDAITFIGSTLKPNLERMLEKLAVAGALLSRSNDYVGEVTPAGINMWRGFYDAGKVREEAALADIRKLVPPKSTGSKSRE